MNPVLSNWNPVSGYLNPLAFSQPADGTFGDLGRNSIFGPSYWNADFSVSKNTTLFEGLNLQVRAELFNIFNHPNFALPGGSVTPGVGPIGTDQPDTRCRAGKSRTWRRRSASDSAGGEVYVLMIGLVAVEERARSARTSDYSNCHSEARPYRARNLLWCCRKQIPRR